MNHRPTHDRPAPSMLRRVGWVLFVLGLVGAGVATVAAVSLVCDAEHARFAHGAVRSIAAARGFERGAGEAVGTAALLSAVSASGLVLVWLRSAWFRWVGWLIAATLLAAGGVGLMTAGAGAFVYYAGSCVEHPEDPACRDDRSPQRMVVSPSRSRWAVGAAAMSVAASSELAMSTGGVLLVGWVASLAARGLRRKQLAAA